MSLLQDLRYAIRLFLKDRWFTAVAAVVLALGIGANNAVFTIVNAVLLRSMPFPNPEQLVVMLTRDTRGRQLGVFEISLTGGPPRGRCRACRSCSVVHST
jgi:hypothetical protein